MKKYMQLKKGLFWMLLPLFLTGFYRCGDGLNLFSVQDDIELGKQLRDEILSDPAQYPVISEAANPNGYLYIRKIRDKILNSGAVKYKNEFAWEVYIIEGDDVLNAFCAPGGYIFVYTGLIKYLDSEDQLAGVLGHEIAHADKRHSTEQLTKLYGIQFLLDIVLGDKQGTVSQIAQGLVGLEFSRANERQSDEWSVRYLCGTDYAADGASDFFAKLITQGQGGQVPTFLSTHPDPGNRVQDIRSLSGELNCAGHNEYQQEYAVFKALF